MIVLLGKTCSGKDTILNKLVKDYKYSKMITYTTRPMRNGEVQDKTYHFISEKIFAEKINADCFLEYKKYETSDGVWYYGSAKEDYEKANDNTIVILTPTGLVALKKYIEKNKSNISITSIYISTQEEVIENRLKNRGDKKEEAERRIKTDNDDFKDVESIVDAVFHNNDGVDIKDIVYHIDKYIKEVKRTNE